MTFCPIGFLNTWGQHFDAGFLPQTTPLLFYESHSRSVRVKVRGRLWVTVYGSVGLSVSVRSLLTKMPHTAYPSMIHQILRMLQFGAFLVTDICVFNRPLGCSLRSFTRTAHSAHLLHSALLCYAPFARSLRT